MALRRFVLGLSTSLAHLYRHEVVAGGMYSPLPRLPDPTAPDTEWLARSEMAGTDWNLARQIEFVDSQLSEYFVEFAPPEDDDGTPARFYRANKWYADADADLLFATVRWAKPRQILELGTGFSTLVSAAACSINAAQGHPCTFVSVDPAPRIELDAGLPGLTELHRQRAEQLSLDRFLSLDRDDILFIDTTHTVKRGSEVIRLVLEVLPRLRPGVLVHFHDIFLPFDYPRRWYEQGLFLNEQWLVQAYLAENPCVELLVAAFALSELAGDRLARMIPSLRGAQMSPSSFWVRRT